METDRKIRRLAAILFADVVGYSRMMAADEVGTLAALKRHRGEEFDPAVAKHNGRIVKLMGDGTLVEFASVVDAVSCALAIQQAVADGRSGLALRVGVNLGDIIIQGDDIYGDGVNVAARLEALAEPGGICISSVVHESIRDRIDAPFRDDGPVEMKNIARPVQIWRWSPGNPVARSDSTTAAPAASLPRSEGPSIAVLAFDNMSGDPEQAYFSDGIAEDIITDLSKVSGLTVIARNSSFAYKGRSVDLRTIARELGVGAVLEGSIRRAGNRVRITAQLIDAASGAHLWADRYDRELTDIFAVQDEVTLKIVEALKVRLTPYEKANIASTGTKNMEAHDNLLQLRSLLHWPGLNSTLWRRAVEFGKRAIELDPGFTHAYALLAIIHMYDYHNHWSGDEPAEVISKAWRLAEQAIQCDPGDATAQHAIAVVARWKGDYDLAASAVDKLLSRTPDNALALFTRAEIAIATGRSRDAVPDLERAIRLDPGFAHQLLQYLGMAHALLGNYETAALVFRERIMLVKDTDIGRAWLAAVLGHLGEIVEARQLWAELLRINPHFSIEQRLANQGFVDRADPNSVMSGLAKAGLPE